MEIIHPTSPKGFIGKSLPPPSHLFCKRQGEKVRDRESKMADRGTYFTGNLLKLRDKSKIADKVFHLSQAI